MENVKQKIIIIEDDTDIADLVEIHLNDLGYVLDRATNGREGLEKACDGNYALIILDLMLPGMDGLEVCKRIRENNKYTPILILSAKSEELDKVLGLELGADDYLTKPFSIRELLARVKAIFRRIEADQAKAGSGQAAEVLLFHNLAIYLAKRKVLLDGTPVDLTAKEFDLLVQFASNPGRAYSRQELLDLVWGYHFDGYDHTVNSHINRLRSKIEKNPAEPLFIQTVWGIGYRFIEPDELPRQ
ncbi:MAG: response regulator transcription factor [Deferribacteres bacterium]|nr:response regulator transcription factor [candidate division KSB1 bacterium]MCB9500909.1 response regulator transcription factor [Deferribacteres bacterium]